MTTDDADLPCTDSSPAPLTEAEDIFVDESDPWLIETQQVRAGLPVISAFRIWETQQIVWNIRNFSICTGKTEVRAVLDHLHYRRFVHNCCTWT